MICEDSFLPITDNDFWEVVFHSQEIVIVIFEKCCWGTAQIMKKVLENLVMKFSNKFKLYKYDLDKFNLISDQFQISNNVTILFFSSGILINSTGSNSSLEIEKILTEMINDKFSNNKL